ncbi:GSU2403 family nucleotidyltransferase fold protein [Jiella sonneratiae]|uniref:Nucleotidyltransferase-like domain-containing protein n=1 Tax=Jiella sonneratiae TaxID=2816856 RepID=A0ABS3J8K6_9HYPH|nr:GSU2403 family nucleotidyltransferase fold protein [Jiella sonneratiae]MBO0906002.1 hypothetical protein [Jiella sonneratiae]
MNFRPLRLDQSRQVADLGQVYATMIDGRDRLAHHRGTMRWKTIKGRDYLYRRSGVKDVSLGPRSADTEKTKAAFDEAKADARAIHDAARRRIEEMAPVNRAMGLGRLPVIAARILRKLDDAGLLGSSVCIVGTNALHCYEAMAGGHFATELASTEDIDLLFDSRAHMQIASDTFPAAGLVGMLQSVDRSFRKLANGFRMANRDNYLVDLIAPVPKDAARSPPQRVGDVEGDLVAVEIRGLEWLVNGPKVSAVVVDMRGLPAPMVCVDPRYFALHKLWVSETDDREAARRRRDRAQAVAVGNLVTTHLPSLRFDDRSLEALPKALRDRAGELAGEASAEGADW